MSVSQHEIRQILSTDIPSRFLEELAIAVGWAYGELYSEVRDNIFIPDDCRLEEFNKRRGDVVKYTIAKIARMNGIDFDVKRLSCNGQSKIILTCGRLVIIQECINNNESLPVVSDYKIELARAHGLVRQLELDLGDRPVKPYEWSGSILAVLLHGSAGYRFSQAEKGLGALWLAVPDSNYRHWITRVDLHDIALYGRFGQSTQVNKNEFSQVDRVIVTRKAGILKREFG